MKEEVQIKAVLVEHQHDALMSFYDRFPRLFVNKLLLKLCEGCLAEFPPTLAHFTTTERAPNAKTRKVVIRLHKSVSPSFWAFYKDLPHGARTVVLVNLMNHYAQLAEADMRLMDRVYWYNGANPVAQTMPSGPAITLAPSSSDVSGKTSPTPGDGKSQTLTGKPGGGGQVNRDDQKEPVRSDGAVESADDPLSRVEISL
jgi:hypothetical protein